MRSNYTRTARCNIVQMLEFFRDLRKLQLPQPGVHVSDPFTEGKGFASRSQHSENMSWLRFAKPTHAVIHGNDGVNLYIFIPPLCGWHSLSASRKAHLGTIEGNFTHVTGRTDSLTDGVRSRAPPRYLSPVVNHLHGERKWRTGFVWRAIMLRGG